MNRSLAAGDLEDHLWHRLHTHFSQEQLLDLMMLAGWSAFAVSYAADGARVELEHGARRVIDVESHADLEM